MKLYRVKIPDIAHAVVKRFVEDGSIEVVPEKQSEAEIDLVAIMEEYTRRDIALREEVREFMADNAVPYEQYGRTRKRIAEKWNHPVGDDVEKYLARQFVENFMLSSFVEEVYAEDRDLYKRTLETVIGFDVDERALREEAVQQIQNVAEGTVDYEIALSKAIRAVKKRHGLIR